MKKRCAGLAVVLLSLVAFGVARADFRGVIVPGLVVVRVDSLKTTSPDVLFLTAGWGTHLPEDTFLFTGVSGSPATISMYGTVAGFASKLELTHPLPDTWYRFGMGVQAPPVKFFGEIGVEEPRSVVERLQSLAVSPSVVTGQMTIRLQPVGAGRPVVEIHDAVGNVIRSLDCTAGASGFATATWNRRDDFGRLVPEGVYFCRYAASGAAAVRKVLVAH
jgi:hypothetical protein